jgi:hypothetical protein
LVRTQVFPKLKGGFNEHINYMEDYDFILRVSEVGLIYHVPEALHDNIVKTYNENELLEINKCMSLIRQMAMQRRNVKHG